MARKSAVSSRPGKFVRRSVADMRAFAKSGKAKEMVRDLAKRGGPSVADLRSMPELTDAELADCYRLRKQPVTVRIDGDVVAWLKGKPGKYQQHLNAALRSVMNRETAAQAGKKRL